MRTSYHFPKLLPALAHLFPPILELVPAEGMPPPRAPPATAALAARALARITAAASLVHDRLVGAATVMNHTQHVLSTIVNEAETRRVISLVSGRDNPDLPCHMELSLPLQLRRRRHPRHGPLRLSDYSPKPFLRNGNHS